jgi:hypothetical protein
MGNPLSNKLNGRRQSAALRAHLNKLSVESHRLTMAKRREPLIPPAVLKKLAASNLPKSKREYTRRLRELLRQHEQTGAA